MRTFLSDSYSAKRVLFLVGEYLVNFSLEPTVLNVAHLGEASDRVAPALVLYVHSSQISEKEIQLIESPTETPFLLPSVGDIQLDNLVIPLF